MDFIDITVGNHEMYHKVVLHVLHASAMLSLKTMNISALFREVRELYCIAVIFAVL